MIRETSITFALSITYLNLKETNYGIDFQVI